MPTAIRESAIGDTAVGVAVAVRADAVGAVVLCALGTGRAGCTTAGETLRSDADAVTDFDSGAGEGADADGVADDFVAHDAGVERLALGVVREAD